MRDWRIYLYAQSPVGYSPALMDALQRENWSGEPARPGESWRLHKFGCPHPKVAVCRSQSSDFGWELILEINGELSASQVCRNSEQVLTTSEQWKKAMIEKGWR